jgi:hypothetical protein
MRQTHETTRNVVTVNALAILEANSKSQTLHSSPTNTSNVARLGHDVICIDVPLLIVIFLELDSVLFLQSLSTLQKILASSSLTPFTEGTSFQCLMTCAR